MRIVGRLGTLCLASVRSSLHRSHSCQASATPGCIPTPTKIQVKHPKGFDTGQPLSAMSYTLRCTHFGEDIILMETLK
jgi:hypothetical protein